jgi:hypothetical protein
VSICWVIALLFCTSAHDPCFISRISIVEQHEGEEKECDDYVQCMEHTQHHQVYDVDVKDESNDELHYRLGLMSGNVNIDEISEDDQDQCHEGTLSRGIPSNKSMLRDHYYLSDKELNPSILSCTGYSNKGGNQSCSNGSSLISFSFRSSVISSTLWKRDLSIDEELPVEPSIEKSYYIEDETFGLLKHYKIAVPV